MIILAKNKLKRREGGCDIPVKAVATIYWARMSVDNIFCLP